MTNNILLFGGTFDPVHNGHLKVARELAVMRGFECVVFVPTSAPPHKPATVAGPADRLAMLKLATAGEGLFTVSEVELARQGPSYTYDTLTAMRAQYGQPARLHWMIGMDMLPDLHKWYRAAELVETAEFVIVPRSPWNGQLEAIFSTLGEHFQPSVIKRLREAVVDTPLADVSSTDIRRRVAAGEDIAALTPAAVAAYIAEKSLYH